MDYAKESLKKHYKWRGKLETVPKMKVDSREALSLAYTPGVAQPCLEIQKNPEKSFQLTGRWNTVAVITNGTAVLGLGDIGPEASMPVMEGKCVLFKAFAGIDAVPICISSSNTDEIVNTIALLQGSFGGINLEDIAAPQCFEIEEKLKARCSIPVFHDDQHGTAVVALAAMLNAFKVTGRTPQNARVVISGAGAAGTAIANLLVAQGFGDIVLSDKFGIIYEGMPNLSPAHAEIAKITNRNKLKGTLANAMCGADAFIGVSAPGIVTGNMVRSMAQSPILFPMANPTPEITPEEALAAGAAVVGTGRSDYPNQINNVLAFPGIFRGALDVRAGEINTQMKTAAAHALAGLVPNSQLTANNIIPAAFDPQVKNAVATAVAKAAIESGVAKAPNGIFADYADILGEL